MLHTHHQSPVERASDKTHLKVFALNIILNQMSHPGQTPIKKNNKIKKKKSHKILRFCINICRKENYQKSYQTDYQQFLQGTIFSKTFRNKSDNELNILINLIKTGQISQNEMISYAISLWIY